MQEEYRNMNKKELQEVISNLEEKLEWYDLFVDYMYDVYINKYNEACEYADNKQKENK